MQKPLRAAVIGVGQFGRHHAKHFAANRKAQLVAVVDVNAERATSIATELGAMPETDFRRAIGHIDVASVAVPTPKHFEIASELVSRGIHVLIEKPITENLDSAVTLSKLAEQMGVVLQVGHIERYSGAYRMLEELCTKPLYIETTRISQWQPRGTEVDVILDLMIHDIDVLLNLVGSQIVKVDAVGSAVYGNTLDIANARLQFASGCVANVTASRISHKAERSLRIFQQSEYFVCDLVERKLIAFRLCGDPQVIGPSAVQAEQINVPDTDSLATEIDEFLDCVADGRHAKVDGEAACAALRIATIIKERIADQLGKIHAQQGHLRRL